MTPFGYEDTIPPIYVIKDVVCFAFTMLYEQISAHPFYQMVLECALDDLV